MTLPEEDYQDVYISAVDHPGLLFVQLMQSCDKYVFHVTFLSCADSSILKNSFESF